MSPKPKKIKTKKDKVDIQKQRAQVRQEHVFDLMVKGLSQVRIAEALNVDVRTIKRDYDAIRDNLVDQINSLKKNFSPTEYWAQYAQELLIQKKEMYAALAESKGDRTLVIRALREINAERIMALKRAGVKTDAVGLEDETTDVMRIIHIHKNEDEE